MQKQSVPYFNVASAFIIIGLLLPHSKNKKDKIIIIILLIIIIGVFENNQYIVTTQTVRKLARTIKNNDFDLKCEKRRLHT